MTEVEDSDKPFVWNTFFIGSEGFREHFKVSAGTPEDLAARRGQMLRFLKEWGAISDVRAPMFGSSDAPKGPSKLDKFTKAAEKQVEPEKDDDPMLNAAKALGLVAEDAVPTTVSTDAHERLSKLNKYKKTEPASGYTETVVVKDAGNILKPNKLAKYATKEKE